MLSVNKLEKIIELEDQLREEYRGQLDEKTAEIERHRLQCAELQEKLDEQQATIEKQLETITELSGKSEGNQRIEQLNRELSNRSEKQTEEISTLKQRVKGLQKDLAEVRATNKTLTQYDPVRMKKNMEANKKKLAEKNKANDLLQKSVNKAKGENAELQRKVRELEARLAEAEPTQDSEEEAAA